MVRKPSALGRILLTHASAALAHGLRVARSDTIRCVPDFDETHVPPGFEIAPCPLCGGSRARPVVQAGDRLAPELPELYTVARCLDCGLAYLRPQPDADMAGRFYPDSYTGGGRSGRIEALETAYRRRQHGEVVRWLARRRPARGRVLDVGCGAGDLLVALRTDGWSAHGVEPSPPGAAQACEVYGLDVVSGRFEQADLQEHSFDVIVFSGVLEHVHDPLGSLRRTRGLLAPGGLVAVLFLPMLESPEARLFGPRWLALDLPRHLTHFEDTTFTVMAARAGLEIVGRETYSRRHSAPQLVGSLAPGLQKHRFYRAESQEGGATRATARVAPLAKRAAFLAATTAAKPVVRLASAAGAPSICSYFLEPAADAGDDAGRPTDRG
jgi:2-polyprenyl-3-methyl-5-hydroxy-6-metoxy-1,4-benzoquinol methylase